MYYSQRLKIENEKINLLLNFLQHSNTFLSIFPLFSFSCQMGLPVIIQILEEMRFLLTYSLARHRTTSKLHFNLYLFFYCLHLIKTLQSFTILKYLGGRQILELCIFLFNCYYIPCSIMIIHTVHPILIPNSVLTGQSIITCFHCRRNFCFSITLLIVCNSCTFIHKCSLLQKFKYLA